MFCNTRLSVYILFNCYSLTNDESYSTSFKELFEFVKMSSKSTNSHHGGRTALPTQDPDSDAEEHPAETPTSEWSNGDLPIIEPSHKSIGNTMGVALAHFTRRLIFPFFLITGLIAAAALVLGWFRIWIFDRFICLIIIIVVTIITSLVAAYGVYKWGAAEEYIEFAGIQNQHYEKSNEKLKTTRTTLKEEVQALQKHIEGLEGETLQLKQCMDQFEDLRESLESITEDNADVLKVVDGLNEQYNRMKMLTMEQDKAQLLLTYYKVMFKFNGEEDKFDRNDYDRFVSRLNKSTRRLFDDNGGFEALDLNNDGHVDPEEFIKVTEMVLGENEEVVRRLTSRYGIQ